MKPARLVLILAAVGIVFLLGIEAGARYRENARGVFFRHTQMLTPSERAELEAKVPAAIQDAAWRLGSAPFVEPRLLAHLATIPESSAKPRAKELARLALISDNPEGQSAIFSQMCGLLADVCERPDGLREFVAEQAHLRQLNPGRHLPLMLLGQQHPPILR